MEVCDEWLESHRKQDMNPTWRAVSNALNRAGCKDLAKEIKDIYKTGEGKLVCHNPLQMC